MVFPCFGSREPPGDAALLVEMEPVFDFLMLKKSDGRKLLRVFHRVDTDWSGAISPLEFWMFFDIERGTFTDQVFDVFDSDASHEVDYREFVMAIWNYCTCGLTQLAELAHELYANKETRTIRRADADRLLDEVFDHDARSANAAGVRAQLYALGSDWGRDDFGVSLRDFIALSRRVPMCLQPAFKLQHAIRSKVLSARFWRNAERKRERTMGDQTFAEIHKTMVLNPSLWPAVAEEKPPTPPPPKPKPKPKKKRRRSGRIHPGGGGGSGNRFSDAVNDLGKKHGAVLKTRRRFRCARGKDDAVALMGELEEIGGRVRDDPTYAASASWNPTGHEVYDDASLCDVSVLSGASVAFEDRSLADSHYIWSKTAVSFAIGVNKTAHNPRGDVSIVFGGR